MSYLFHNPCVVAHPVFSPPSLMRSVQLGFPASNPVAPVAHAPMLCLVRLTSRTPATFIPPSQARSANVICHFVRTSISISGSHANGTVKNTYAPTSHSRGRTGILSRTSLTAPLDVCICIKNTTSDHFVSLEEVDCRLGCRHRLGEFPYTHQCRSLTICFCSFR